MLFFTAANIFFSRENYFMKVLLGKTDNHKGTHDLICLFGDRPKVNNIRALLTICQLISNPMPNDLIVLISLKQFCSGLSNSCETGSWAQVGYQVGFNSRCQAWNSLQQGWSLKGSFVHWLVVSQAKSINNSQEIQVESE